MICNKCDSGNTASLHYYAGKIICSDCPNCWQKNDDEHMYKLFPHLKKKKSK